MRGQRKLFNSLGQKETSSGHKETSANRGRSQSLIEKRNQMMIYRYYFFASFTDYRYEKILERLSEEFFLSSVTITGILTESYDQIQTVRVEALSPQQLEKKFPKLKWSEPR